MNAWHLIAAVDEDGFVNQNVVPDDDTYPHVYTALCWCEPEVDEDGTLVHNAHDQRELFEAGVRKLT